MSFTPGPWDFSWEIQPNGCPTVGHKGLMVCVVAHSAKEPEQKKTALANASLIAAAPELLEALEKATDNWEGLANEFMHTTPLHQRQLASIAKVRAVIAKARGEGV